MNPSETDLIARLKADTSALAMPEGRRVGQRGHDKAREYLLGRLREIGLVPFLGRSFALPYDRPDPENGDPLRFNNLAGVIPGRNPGLAPLLLGAHYDSVIDGPCADDNATSVALNLAIAERFVREPLERDLIIALFDAEEPPHFHRPTMGAIRFHEDHCQGIDFAGVIVSDLIGHDLCPEDLRLQVPGLGWLAQKMKDIVFVLGAESDPVFPGIVEEASAKARRLKVLPTLNDYLGSLSDHLPFELQGQPFLFLSCGRGRYYHHPLDDLRWINFRKLAWITDFVAHLLLGIDKEPGQRGRPRVDPVEFEIRMMRKAAGSTLPMLLTIMGRPMPSSRQDINRMMSCL